MLKPMLLPSLCVRRPYAQVDSVPCVSEVLPTVRHAIEALNVVAVCAGARADDESDTEEAAEACAQALGHPPEARIETTM